MGKIAFFTISDQEGQIQLYLDKRIINLNLEKQKLLSFEDIKEIVDIGDWLGVQGTIKKTNKGELSIKVEKWEMLSKSCLLYTSPSPRDGRISRMPSSA